MFGDGDTPANESERGRLRREREHLRRLRINEAGVALAALLVSLSVLGVNAFLYWRGSQLVVLQPEQVLFFKDSGPTGATLWVAIQAQMVNASRNHGDVVVSATALLNNDSGRGEFKYWNLVESVLTSDVERGVANCPVGARCIPQTGFYVIERPKKLLDVPGGSSRTEFLAFFLEPSVCDGETAFCAMFRDYESAVAFLRTTPDPVIELTLRYQFDGVKRLQCSMPHDLNKRAEWFDYLDRKGFATPLCETS